MDSDLCKTCEYGFYKGKFVCCWREKYLKLQDGEYGCCKYRLKNTCTRAPLSEIILKIDDKFDDYNPARETMIAICAKYGDEGKK